MKNDLTNSVSYVSPDIQVVEFVTGTGFLIGGSNIEPGKGGYEDGDDE